MSDQLTKTTVSPLVPSDFDSMWRFAQMVHSARVGGTKTAEEAAFLISYGLELGITPIKAVQSLHLIKGKVTMSADMMVSLCLRDSRCEYIEVKQLTDEACTYIAKRVGRPEQTFSFTMTDAKRAGLAGGDNWRKYPKAMLKARAGSHIARQVFPDIVMGIYDPDEIQNVGTAQVIEDEPVEATIEENAPSLEGQLEDIAGAYWPEFYEALTVAKGSEPDDKTLAATLRKLRGMAAVERDEWMQAKIDQYLVAEAEEVDKPDDDGVQDADFEPAGPGPLKSAVVMAAMDLYRKDDQPQLAVTMNRMAPAEKKAFLEWCSDNHDQKGAA
jgi:hypothetical protein